MSGAAWWWTALVACYPPRPVPPEEEQPTVDTTDTASPYALSDVQGQFTFQFYRDDALTDVACTQHFAFEGLARVGEDVLSGEGGCSQCSVDLQVKSASDATTGGAPGHCDSSQLDALGMNWGSLMTDLERSGWTDYALHAFVDFKTGRTAGLTLDHATSGFWTYDTVADTLASRGQTFTHGWYLRQGPGSIAGDLNDFSLLASELGSGPPWIAWGALGRDSADVPRQAGALEGNYILEGWWYWPIDDDEVLGVIWVGFKGEFLATPR